MTSLKNHPNEFSVLTLNILAPCYKRLSNESDRESYYEKIWMERHLSIIELLQSLDLDLICLQEFWLTDKTFCDFYRSHFSSKYLMFTLQRTHQLDDGVAIFIRQNRFEMKGRKDLLLNDIGNRVGLLLHLKLKETNHSIVLVNIHLTFPHHSSDRQLRLTQMKRFLQLIDEFLERENVCQPYSILLCGDFNSPHENDPVDQLILKKSFQSSYRFVHGGEPRVTHLTHRNEEVATDFIFYRSDCLRPLSTQLIPKDCDPSRWNDHTHWTLSDHRAILTKFRVDSH